MHYVYNEHEFRLVQDVETPGAIRIYVLRQPMLGNVHPVYIEAPPFLLLKDVQKPRTLQQAQQIAQAWVDAGQRFLAGLQEERAEGGGVSQLKQLISDTAARIPKRG